MKEQTTMENLISQVKESPFWDLPPTALVLIGICLLPVASCISFFITSISLLFIAFLAFEGNQYASQNQTQTLISNMIR